MHEKHTRQTIRDPLSDDATVQQCNTNRPEKLYSGGKRTSKNIVDGWQIRNRQERMENLQGILLKVIRAPHIKWRMQLLWREITEQQDSEYGTCRKFQISLAVGFNRQNIV